MTPAPLTMTMRLVLMWLKMVALGRNALMTMSITQWHSLRRQRKTYALTQAESLLWVVQMEVCLPGILAGQH